MIYAFDFEWTNKTIMYGSYKRTHSMFQNSNMMAVGKPAADELALLEPFRGKVPDEVFGEPFVPPVSDGSGQDRALLRKASALLQEAGFVVKDGKRVTPQGERFSVEFLLDEPSFQPHHMTFIKNLGVIGIEATLAHGRPRAVSASASTISTSISWCSGSAFRARPAIRCGAIFPRRLPPSRARRISPAFPIRSSMR